MNTEIEIPEELKQFVPEFLSLRDEEVKTLKFLFSQKDFDGIAKIAHKVKGIAAPYGFPQLEYISQNLEDSANRFNESSVLLGIDIYEKYLENYK